MKRIFLLLLVALTAVQCNDDDDSVDQAAIDNEIILQYIADNDLDAQDIGRGLYFVDEETGTGENPTASSTVRVAYRGYFPSGQVFDLSDPGGVVFSLNQVIEGWTIGIPYFKTGGKGMLLIPSALAYGTNPPPGIPANSVLIFDIHLINIL